MSSSPLANTPDPLPNGFQVGVVRASCGVQLSPEKAVEIYKEKLARSVPKTFHASLQSLNARIRGQSVPLAIRYGVSPKTIRCVCRWLANDSMTRNHMRQCVITRNHT